MDIAGGASFIAADGSHFGAAVTRSESRYGLPTGFSFDPAAPVRIEAALRWETTAIEARPDLALGNLAASRDYSGLSGALGASYTAAPGWVIAASGFFSRRAPVVEELFTQGTDPGTQGVLLGNPDLPQETAWGLEAVVRGFGASWSLEASAYYNRFPDYIYTAQTAAVVDGLPVFQFLADAAEYCGFEVQGKADLFDLGSITIGGDALVDYTRASLSDGAPVPRIPPLRALGGVSARADRFDARIEVEWADRMTRLGAFETPTEGYVLANASFDWRPFADRPALTLGIAANNIFDDTVRRHASFLKDFAPVAGRDIRLRARIAF